MRIVRTVADLREAITDARSVRHGRATVGLVPTMGAFHEGHLSLIRAARQAADVVVVWLFVNPAQFNEASDLAAYPRDEQRDALLAADCGADLLFAPTVAEVYPTGFATTVRVAGLGEVYEGAHRPGHFDGVATVVAKMLGMVGPDIAFFGAKDVQQVAVVRRLVADLDIPTRIEVLPTVREPDGLAMSSRNVHLSSAQRQQATALSRGLRAAADAVEAGQTDPAQAVAAVKAVLSGEDIQPEYLAVVDPDTFIPVTRIAGPALLIMAARIGPTRLIDNIRLDTRQGATQ